LTGGGRRAAQRLRNWVARGRRPPLTGLDTRLLAYAAAGILALLPLTPGGLGIVEAGLSGLTILAGVHPGYAVLAILAYRIASYRLPLLAGLPAYFLFRHRYERPTPRSATPGGGGRPTAGDAASL
jgi:hypothetical protein